MESEFRGDDAWPHRLQANLVIGAYYATISDVSYVLRVKRVELCNHILGETHFSGAGHNALNLNPSFACTIASSLVIASTAPLLAV